MAEFPSYVEARAAVEALVGEGFPADRLAIVAESNASDERPDRAAFEWVLPGAIVGAVFGFVLVMLLIWADPLADPSMSAGAYGALFGSGAGAVIGWGLRRPPEPDGAPQAAAAARYTVVSDPPGAEEAAQRLRTTWGFFRPGA